MFPAPCRGFLPAGVGRPSKAEVRVYATAALHPQLSGLWALGGGGGGCYGRGLEARVRGGGWKPSVTDRKGLGGGGRSAGPA